MAFLANTPVLLKSSNATVCVSRRSFLRRPRSRAQPTVVRMVAGEKQGQTAKAAEFAKLYGGSYLGTSMGMAVVSYALWYLAVQSGVDVVALVQSLGDWLATTPVGRPAILGRVNETVGTATLAYIAHKASSPLRFPLTIAATPFVARVFKGKGAADEPSKEE